VKDLILKLRLVKILKVGFKSTSGGCVLRVCLVEVLMMHLVEVLMVHLMEVDDAFGGGFDGAF
jgi:hypothetical protein